MDLKKIVLLFTLCLTSVLGNSLQVTSSEGNSVNVISASEGSNVKVTKGKNYVLISETPKDIIEEKQIETTVKIVEEEVESLRFNFDKWTKVIEAKTFKVLQGGRIVVKDLSARIYEGAKILPRIEIERLEQINERWLQLEICMSKWIKTEQDLLLEQCSELERLGNLYVTKAEPLVLSKDVVQITEWKSGIDQWMEMKKVFLSKDLGTFETKLTVVEEALDVLGETHLTTVIEEGHGLNHILQIWLLKAWSNFRETGFHISDQMQGALNTGIGNVKQVVIASKKAFVTTGQKIGDAATTGVESIGGVVNGAAKVVWNVFKGGNAALSDIFYHLRSKTHDDNIVRYADIAKSSVR